jgi:hypothetical protein
MLKRGVESSVYHQELDKSANIEGAICMNCR